MKREELLLNIGGEINELLMDYMRVESFTFSHGEVKAEEFFTGWFSRLPYFKEHPENLGRYPIADDPLGRSVCYAMVRGSGPDTVVLLHHYDVVGVEDYKLLAPYAFEPEMLEAELHKISGTLDADARGDLESGDWLFAHGPCDMKGGGSIQMTLLARYSALPGFNGNIIVLGVPDEENLSAGMRGAAPLLAELKERYGLNYLMMINSEPHQRREKERGIFSVGSVGKLMPFIYVRGFMAHAGKVFEGLNPFKVMAEVVRRTETAMEFSDSVAGQAAPPPTWLYLRDDKQHYDVSMPLSAFGCLSILTLDRTPADVLNALKRICTEAFEAALCSLNADHDRFLSAMERKPEKLPWKPCVMDFASLMREAEANHGEEFKTAYAAFFERLCTRLHECETTLIAAHGELVAFVYDYIDDLAPRIIYGLTPPYYPNVSKHLMSGLSKEAETLTDTLAQLARERFGEDYDTEAYFTGISDLSYTGMKDGAAIGAALSDAMPLFGSYYRLPLSDIEKITMPCVNIGPWGKDFHKLTERVYKKDLLERTPALVEAAIEHMLG